MGAFVGYWGGDQGESESLLSRAVETSGVAEAAAHRLSLSPFRSAGNDALFCATGVAAWGAGAKLRRSPDRATLAASLSASGLSADAGVIARGDSLTLSRERFGRAPLFWTRLGQTVWFASRLQLLLPLLSQAEVSAPALYAYTCFSYVPSPLTPVQGVFARDAGGELEWRKSGANDFAAPFDRRGGEWCADGDDIGDEREAVAELRAHLRAAIETQTSDLALETAGVFLSGGLDSAVTAALLVRAGVKTRAYTLDFGDDAFPEWPYAARVAEWLKMPLVKVRVTPRRVRRAIDATAAALDLPFGDGVTVPLYLLNEAAAREVSVVFNGEGGDQFFAGWTNKPLIAAGVYAAEQPAGGDFAREYLRTFHRLHGHEAQVFSPALLAEIAALDPRDWLAGALSVRGGEELLHRLRRANLTLKGAQNIQPRATNLAFAHGLRVRSPFCDEALARWTFRASGDLWLRGSHEKYLLKRAVEGWLPAEVVWREKRGMGVPLTAWCLKGLRREVAARLRPAVLRREGCWQPDIAARIAAGELSGQVQGRRVGECLWLLLMWQVWRTAVLRDRASRFTHSPLRLPLNWRVWRVAAGVAQKL
jgi:asparagine synthase (glutamine-hydrolysing)